MRQRKHHRASTHLDNGRCGLRLGSSNILLLPVLILLFLLLGRLRFLENESITSVKSAT